MILLGLIAQWSPAAPALTHHDVPVELVRQNVVQTVGIALTVSPDGKVQDCLVERSSGTAKLDAYTCQISRRRARFTPPRRSDGATTYGVYRKSIDWWVGDGNPPRRAPSADIYLTVAKLPPNEKPPVAIPLLFAVDETGRVSDCLAQDAKHETTLVRVACKQLMQDFKPAPARNAQGTPVNSLQTATVVFQTD